MIEDEKLEKMWADRHQNAESAPLSKTPSRRQLTMRHAASTPSRPAVAPGSATSISQQLFYYLTLRALRLRKSKLVADQVHQVGGILPVMDRKVGVEPDLAGVFPQKPCSNAIEGTTQVRASLIMPALAGAPPAVNC
jgi:hypothetical protein